MLRFFKKAKNFINPETYFSLIATNQKNITTSTEKILEERKSVDLI